MAGEIRNYDPDRITATWVITSTGESVDLTQGLIDGAGAMSESKDAPRWTRRGDRQGNMVRNKSRKKGGTLTFTYVAEAEIHDVFRPIINRDEQLQDQVGVIVIKDLNGATLHTFVGAFIEDDPSMNYGDSEADRAYVFGYAERQPVFAGAIVR